MINALENFTVEYVFAFIPGKQDRQSDISFIYALILQKATEGEEKASRKYQLTVEKEAINQKKLKSGKN